MENKKCKVCGQVGEKCASNYYGSRIEIRDPSSPIVEDVPKKVTISQLRDFFEDRRKDADSSEPGEGSLKFTSFQLVLDKEYNET